MMLVKMVWEHYQSLAAELIKHLMDTQYEPDVIVGIARGGLIPMVTLSSHFKTRKVGVIFMQKTASDEAFAYMLPNAICLGHGIPVPINGQKVLLVDNIIQTGQTIRGASEVLTQLGAKEIKTASICSHKGKYEFNHYAPMGVEADDWVEFPWDISPVAS